MELLVKLLLTVSPYVHLYCYYWF